MDNIKEMLKSIEDEDVKLVRFLLVDNDGIIRCCASGISCLEGDLISGHPYNIATNFLGSTDLVNPYSRFGAVGEIRAVPDTGTFRIAPYAKQTATMICDTMTSNNEVSELCARSALKRMLKSISFDVMASFENEFFLIKETDDGQIMPFDNSYYCSSIGMQNANEIILDIVKCLEKQSITVEKYYKEYSPGQQEVVCKYTDALGACDNQVIFRETARSVASSHGLLATFIPKPFNDFLSSGCHTHISLWKDGKNMFYDENGKNSLSKTALYFIGGILRHTRALCLFTSPTVNSYKRLIPGHWASGYTFYGIDNREAAVRVCSPQKGRESESLNIEFKATDGTCNPYIALTALIAAGMDGIKNEIDPGDPLQIMPSEIPEEERIKRGIYRYPGTLGEAIECAEKTPLFREVFGDVFFEEYLVMKKFLWEEYCNSVTDWELKKSLHVF